VGRSAEVGLINLVGESSVGSANRRIESLVGIEAFRVLAAERASGSELTNSLKTPREQLPDRIAALVADLKAAERKIAQFESGQLAQRVPAILANARSAGRVTLVSEHVGALNSADDLRGLVTTVRERLGSDGSVVALAADVAGKPAVIVATNDASRAAGLKAGALAKLAAGILGGGGGGKDDLAQGGGSDVAAIPAALDAIAKAVAE
jgi:alanyl-tRNA synthetase